MTKTKLYTLAFIRNGDNILLGMKKRGFGVGRWNGFGGKVNSDETILEAAKRSDIEKALHSRVLSSCTGAQGNNHCIPFVYETLVSCSVLFGLL